MGSVPDPDRFFSRADREAIRRAADEAEKSTAGEIVPYVVGRCDAYPETRWRGAAWGAVLATLVAALVHGLGGFWGGELMSWLTLPAVLGALAGHGVSGLPGLHRRLVPAETLDQRVDLRAAAAFLEEEVFATRERTGILLFVALFEHRVVVLADAGIHARVKAGEWQRIADGITEGIRRGRPAPAMVEAIGRCGELLARRGVERRPDDENELPDDLRLATD